jgi:large subunit ribosomal protein L14e
VEVGRVVLINYGPDAGKLATIVDIVDSKNVLIDGPQKITGVHRQTILLKRVSLTDFVVAKLPRNSTQKNLVKGWTEQGIKGKWDATAWAKKLAAKKARAEFGDFDRFKLYKAKQELSAAINKALK